MILQRLGAEGKRAGKRSKNVFGAALPGRWERRAHYETGKVTWVLFLTFVIFFFPEMKSSVLAIPLLARETSGQLDGEKTRLFISLPAPVMPRYIPTFAH